MTPIQIVVSIILIVSLFIKGKRILYVIKNKDNSGALKAELFMLTLIVIIGILLLYFIF